MAWQRPLLMSPPCCLQIVKSFMIGLTEVESYDSLNFLALLCIELNASITLPLQLIITRSLKEMADRRSSSRSPFRSFREFRSKIGFPPKDKASSSPLQVPSPPRSKQRESPVPGRPFSDLQGDQAALLSVASLQLEEATKETSLWQIAYKQLEIEEKGLFTKYQNAIANDKSIDSSVATYFVPKNIFQKGRLEGFLERARQAKVDHQSTIKLGSSIIVVADQVDKVISGIIWAKDIIGTLLPPEPHVASIWGAVCCLLPVRRLILQKVFDYSFMRHYYSDWRSI